MQHKKTKAGGGGRRGGAGGGGGGGGVTPLQPDRFYFVKILTHFVLYKMAK